MFQSFNLIDELTVYENVELPLVYGNVPHAERKPRVEAVLEEMDIAHRRGHFPAQLSGGQQQRVAVARARGKSPTRSWPTKSTGNLDSEHGDEVMKLLLKLNEEGTTIGWSPTRLPTPPSAAASSACWTARWSRTRPQAAQPSRGYLVVALRNLHRDRLYGRNQHPRVWPSAWPRCLILGLFLKSELTYDRHYTWGEEHLPHRE